MRNTPTGFITIPSLLGSPAALRSPNRRAPSPTKVPAQWASGRCKKLGCATGAVSPGGPGIGTSRSFIYIYIYVFIYIYIYRNPKKIGRENSHYVHGIWWSDVSIFSHIHTRINIISKATPSPTTISTPWWRPLATESPWQWQVPQTLKTSRDLPFIGNSLALQPTIANPSPNLQVATSKTLRSVSTKAFIWQYFYLGWPSHIRSPASSIIQGHPGLPFGLFEVVSQLPVFPLQTLQPGINQGPSPGTHPLF